MVARPASAERQSWKEDFAFDPTGNWNGTSRLQQRRLRDPKVSGTITLSQNRTNTEANEISAIPTATGTAWQVPAYDSNGNAHHHSTTCCTGQRLHLRLPMRGTA